MEVGTQGPMDAPPPVSTAAPIDCGACYDTPSACPEDVNVFPDQPEPSISTSETNAEENYDTATKLFNDVDVDPAPDCGSYDDSASNDAGSDFNNYSSNTEEAEIDLNSLPKYSYDAMTEKYGEGHFRTGTIWEKSDGTLINMETGKYVADQNAGLLEKAGVWLKNLFS